jgi:hypothetical protein
MLTCGDGSRATLGERLSTKPAAQRDWSYEALSLLCVRETRLVGIPASSPGSRAGL